MNKTAIYTFIIIFSYMRFMIPIVKYNFTSSIHPTFLAKSAPVLSINIKEEFKS